VRHRPRSAADRARDTLGRVYEYFLARFASAEGKSGGQFYTPSHVVRVLVEMLAPYKGRVCGPYCGSGGMFVQSEKFIEAHAGKLGDISIYGQESNDTTWRLAKMNRAIRAIDAQIAHRGTFYDNGHPDLKADYVLANPPISDSDWRGARVGRGGDAREGDRVMVAAGDERGPRRTAQRRLMEAVVAEPFGRQPVHGASSRRISTTFGAPLDACTGCGNCAGSESRYVRPTFPGKWKSGRGSTLGVPPVCAKLVFASASSATTDNPVRNVMAGLLRVSLLAACRDPAYPAGSAGTFGGFAGILPRSA
jgi:hypothetical protein